MYSDNNESKSLKADKFTSETTCTPDRFCLFVGKLLEDKKNSIREIRFRSLLEIQCGQTKRQLCRWLVDQFKPKCSKSNFKIVPHNIFRHRGHKRWSYTTQLGGLNENAVELQDIFQSTVRGINIETLEDIIKQLDEINWIFKVCNKLHFGIFMSTCIIILNHEYILYFFHNIFYSYTIRIFL